MGFFVSQHIFALLDIHKLTVHKQAYLYFHHNLLRIFVYSEFFFFIFQYLSCLHSIKKDPLNNFYKFIYIQCTVALAFY